MESSNKSGIVEIPCTSAIEQISNELNGLRILKDNYGVEIPKTKHYYFIELLATDSRYGIQKGWYFTEKSAEDKTFSSILGTKAHPHFIKTGPETRVYRWWAQPVISRKTDTGPAPLFDTRCKQTKKGLKPIAYRVSKNGLDALKIHFGKRLILR